MRRQQPRRAGNVAATVAATLAVLPAKNVPWRSCFLVELVYLLLVTIHVLHKSFVEGKRGQKKGNFCLLSVQYLRSCTLWGEEEALS